jgi:hypothetical protein
MLTTKRVFIATICGIIFGLVCMWMASSGEEEVGPLIKLSIVFSRTIMGFMIGISALKLHWWLHGIILGFVGSIPMAIPILSDMKIAIATVVMGIIYGFLIELITSIIFKQKPVGMLIKNISEE